MESPTTSYRWKINHVAAKAAAKNTTGDGKWQDRAALSERRVALKVRSNTPSPGKLLVSNNKEKGQLMFLTKVLTLVDTLRAPAQASAHCDLPCGVYDPAQARIEAESIKAIVEKYNASDDQYFRDRATLIKEERAAEVNHHLDVLWYQYFQPAHLEKYPQLHEVFWNAKKLTSQVKRANDVAIADQLLASIGQISDIFWETKK
jgi:nickel superoxide dismutase